VGMRGDLNERRKRMIRMAFDILDTDRSGVITVDEIAAVYDVSHNPDVQAGRKTKKEALLEFMRQVPTIYGMADRMTSNCIHMCALYCPGCSGTASTKMAW
jgi:Ca2+-binding EF-hand superfamily protein